MTYDDHKKHIDSELARLTKSVEELLEVASQVWQRLDALQERVELLECPPRAPAMTPEEFDDLCRQVHAARPVSVSDLFNAPVGGTMLPGPVLEGPFVADGFVAGGTAVPNPGLTFR